MATESYEAAIKGLNDLLRYDQRDILSPLLQRIETIITLKKKNCRHIRLPRSNYFCLHESIIVWLNFWNCKKFDVESEKRSFDISVVCVFYLAMSPRHLGFRTRTTDPNRRSRFYFISLFTPIYALFNLLFFWGSKKTDLGNVAAEKIKVLTQELKELDSSNNDAVERIKSGFTHFKTEKYLWVFFYSILLFTKIK